MPDRLPAPNPTCNTLNDNLPSLSSHPPTILELRVRNHPGTMSHLTGLFARRAFNLDAILCVPNADRATSRMLLLVPHDPRLVQLERQLARLYDVLEIRHRTDLSADVFERLPPP